jgi:hypothetical protein
MSHRILNTIGNCHPDFKSELEADLEWFRRYLLIMDVHRMNLAYEVNILEIMRAGGDDLNQAHSAHSPAGKTIFVTVDPGCQRQ